MAAEAALDGIYVVRTSVDVGLLGAPGVVAAYKALANVERDFRSLKTVDLELRPIYQRLDRRVRGHVLLCMLAAYLTWHLRRTWTPLCFTDPAPPDPTIDPVGPAQRSAEADTKATRRTTPDGHPAHSLASLLDHLATLTRNRVRFTGTDTVIDKLAEPTPIQRRAFELLNAPIPLKIR